MPSVDKPSGEAHIPQIREHSKTQEVSRIRQVLSSFGKKIQQLKTATLKEIQVIFWDGKWAGNQPTLRDLEKKLQQLKASVIHQSFKPDEQVTQVIGRSGTGPTLVAYDQIKKEVKEMQAACVQLMEKKEVKKETKEKIKELQQQFESVNKELGQREKITAKNEELMKESSESYKKPVKLVLARDVYKVSEGHAARIKLRKKDTANRIVKFSENFDKLLNKLNKSKNFKDIKEVRKEFEVLSNEVNLISLGGINTENVQEGLKNLARAVEAKNKLLGTEQGRIAQIGRARAEVVKAMKEAEGKRVRSEAFQEEMHEISNLMTKARDMVHQEIIALARTPGRIAGALRGASRARPADRALGTAEAEQQRELAQGLKGLQAALTRMIDCTEKLYQDHNPGAKFPDRKKLESLAANLPDAADATKAALGADEAMHDFERILIKNGMATNPGQLSFKSATDQKLADDLAEAYETAFQARKQSHEAAQRIVFGEL